MGTTYEVLDEKGVAYPSRGYEGGPVEVWPKGSIIRQKDIDAGRISLGGLEFMAKNGRVRGLGDPREAPAVTPSNKKQGTASKKGLSEELV